MTMAASKPVAQQKINELNEAEEPAKELLRRLGYTYVPRDVLAGERNNEREVLLKGRLGRALVRLNPWMKPDHVERVIFNLENVDAVGMARNQAVHDLLIYGMPLDIDEPSGRRTRTVRFFDFDHPEPSDGLNEFVVTTQMRVRRGNERANVEDDEKVVKPDLVLFVNGIPLVVMEAKSPTLLDVWKAKAVKQLLRYQEASPEWHGCGAPELFDYNLMCVAHCGASAVYAALGARESEYVEWKSTLPYADDDVRQRFSVEPKGQAQLIIGLLAPATLLDVLRDFVVFEPEKGRLVKKLPRYQQHRAVTVAVERFLAKDKPEERGGVVWHTQGSGKSLTMLFLATKLRREPRLRNPTLVIVTDRKQLDKQISETFRRCGFPAPEHAETTKSLRQLLTTGAGRTIMTTIQKFDDVLQATKAPQETLNDDDNLFVMVDEAHRTQYGLLAAKMRRAMSRGVFIGFTGTPIDKGFKRSTMVSFGPLIGEPYRIKESVEDGATVPIYYEARLPELAILGPNTLDRLFDTLFADNTPEERERIRRRYANKRSLAEAERRIQMVSEDIARHYKEHVKPNGFKIQVVAPSRLMAMRYAEHLRSFGVSAYPVITTTNNDSAVFKWAKEVDQEQIIGAFKDPDGDPEALVVVDMLLTGFDAPVEQVLYLDRELREHGLLQAIARVNRRCTLRPRPGIEVEKTYGLVVDYYGISQELASALSEFDPEDLQDTWTPTEEDPAAVVDAVADRAEYHFKGKNLEDTWACVEVFIDDEAEGGFKADLFERFNADYREFSQLMDRFLPDPQALAYVDRLTRLTKIRAYVRAQYLRVDGDIDWTDVSAKVKNLIDSRIDAEVRELMKPVSILDQNFDEKIEHLPHDEARASLMEHAIRAQIKERVDENPVFYEKLSEQLERIIAEMRQKLIDAAEAVRRLAALRDTMKSEASIAAEHGLTEVSLAVYELLEQAQGGLATQPGTPSAQEDRNSYHVSFDEGLKSVALRVEEAMRHGQIIVDWQSRDDVQRMMRRDIKRELRQVGGLTEEEIEELARSMVEVARRKLAR